MSNSIGYKEMIKWRLDLIKNQEQLIKSFEKSNFYLKKEIKEIEKKYLESLESLVETNKSN